MPKFAVDINAEQDDFLSVPINISASGSNTIIAGANGVVISIYRLILVAAANNTITFLDASTPISGPIFLSANQSLFFRFDTKPWFDTSVGNGFSINLASSQQISGILYYTAVAAQAGALLLEDQSSHLLLEDGTSRVLLER